MTRGADPDTTIASSSGLTGGSVEVPKSPSEIAPPQPILRSSRRMTGEAMASMWVMPSYPAWDSFTNSKAGIHLCRSNLANRRVCGEVCDGPRPPIRSGQAKAAAHREPPHQRGDWPVGAAVMDSGFRRNDVEGLCFLPDRLEDVTQLRVILPWLGALRASPRSSARRRVPCRPRRGAPPREVAAASRRRRSAPRQAGGRR